MESSTIYQIMVNWAAGDYYVNKYTSQQWENWQENGIRSQEGHYNEVSICFSQEEVEIELEGLKGKTVYAVFEDSPSGNVFDSEENNLSGNWRGNKYGHFSCIAEYKYREDAELHVKELREYYHNLCYYKEDD